MTPSDRREDSGPDMSSVVEWARILQDVPWAALPAEFWEHLGRALEEVGQALRVLAEHVDDAAETERLYEAYDRVMRGRMRVGPPGEE